MTRPLTLLRLLPLMAGLAALPVQAQDAAPTETPEAAQGAQAPSPADTSIGGGLQLGESAEGEASAPAGQQQPDCRLVMMLGGPTHLEARPLHGRNNLAQSGSKDHR